MQNDPCPLQNDQIRPSRRHRSETDSDRRTAAFFLEVITEIALREVKKSGEFTFPGIGNW